MASSHPSSSGSEDGDSYSRQSDTAYSSGVAKPAPGRWRGVKTGETSTDDREDIAGPPATRKAPRQRRRIRVAPLKIPLKRRLQTAAVLFHEFTIPLYISLFWFLLAIPLTWPVLVPYLLYCLFSNAHVNGSSPQRRSHFLRRLPLWRLYTGYFPMQLHKSADLDPQRNYIFTYHPHGIISHGAFGHFCTERTTGFETLFPGITTTLLTLDSNFRVPFYRDYLLSMGLASVSRRSCEALLRAAPAGRAITIVLGGAQESLEATPGRMALIVKRRRGFLKIAIRENAGVVPVLSFGENELYEQMVPHDGGLLQWVQRALKRVAGFTVPLFHARGVFNYDVGLMPYRRAVNSVGRFLSSLPTPLRKAER